MRPFIGALGLVLWLASSAWAIPDTMTVYTDRAAFDRAAGPYTLLTLDAPDAIGFSRGGGAETATYANLITFLFDPEGGGGLGATPSCWGLGGMGRRALPMVS